MAGPTVGRAEIKVDFDGSALPKQAKRLAGKAGDNSGLAFTKSFLDQLNPLSKEIAQQMKKSGKIASQSVRDGIKQNLKKDLAFMGDLISNAVTSKGGFKRFAKEVGGADEAIKRLNESLEEAHIEKNISKRDVKQLTAQVNRWAEEVREAERRIIAEKQALIDSNNAKKIATERAKALREETARLNKAQRDAAAQIAAERTRLLRVETERLNKVQKDLNVALANQKNWDLLIANSDNAHDSFNRLVAKMDELRTSGRLTDDQYRVLSARMGEFTKSADDVDKANDSNTDSFDRSSAGMNRYTRRLALIIGAIVAAAPGIAGLGSVVGSLVTVLTNSVLALGIGVGVAIAAFKGLGGTISELPAAVQPAAVAFQALGDSFDLLQDKIQAAAAPGLTRGFEILADVVEGLTPALEAFGAIVGSVFQNFAASIAPGTEGFKNINTIIQQSGPIFESLIVAISSFSHAFEDIMIAAGPITQAFADGLREIANQFAAWTSSTEGQAAMKEFFETLSTLGPPLLDLVGSLGTSLASLVTPAAIEQLSTFITSLSNFLPVVAQVLDLVTQLKVLEIIAVLFDAIGQALTPIMPLLVQTAQILGEALVNAVIALTPIFVQLVAAIAPILPVLAQLVADILVSLVPALIPLIDVVLQLLDAIMPLMPSFGELSAVILDAVILAIVALLPLLTPLIDFLIELLDAVAPLMPIFVLLVRIALMPVIAAIQILSPIIGGLIKILLALLSPVLQSVTAFLKSKDGMKQVTDATKILTDVVKVMGDVFKGVGTVVKNIGSFFDDVAGSIDGFIGMVNDAIGAVQNFLESLPAPGNPFAGFSLPFASGGTVMGPTFAMLGEAGPEVVVPLARPLNQIDPSVRGIAAFAQGKSTGVSGSPDGSGRGGRITNIEAGAIVVQTVASPFQTANAILDRIVASAAV